MPTTPTSSKTTALPLLGSTMWQLPPTYGVVASPLLLLMLLSQGVYGCVGSIQDISVARTTSSATTSSSRSTNCFVTPPTLRSGSSGSTRLAKTSPFLWLCHRTTLPQQQPPRRQRPSPTSFATTTTRLCGIAEWRDTFFDFPGTGDDRRLGTESGGPPKSINLLPFPYPEVLLQGETKQLRLYEDRFVQLFEDSLSQHGGVVAMGLLADAGIVQTVPVCELEAYNRMLGDGFGIFVTIRVVGRARVLEIVQQEPYLQAVVTELNDRLPPNLELPNLVASNIENDMLLLSSMEYRLEQAKKDNSTNIKDPLDYDKTMQQRIRLAKLEDTFYDEGTARDDDDHDDDDDDDDSLYVDRRKRFRRAYEIALETDTQGYQSPAGNAILADHRTPQELTAVSWAAFCSELLSETDAPFRVQALCTETLFDRLKLASAMLQRKKKLLRTRMETAGLRLSGEELDDDDNGIGGDSGSNS